MRRRMRCAGRCCAGRTSCVSARGLRTTPSWPATWCRGARPPTCSGSRAGRGWPARICRWMSRPPAVALLRQLDFHASELALIDADLGQAALGRPEVLRLMTIPGVDATVALSIVAAVGDFTRFRTPERLVSYFGLNPP